MKRRSSRSTPTPGAMQSGFLKRNHDANGSVVTSKMRDWPFAVSAICVSGAWRIQRTRHHETGSLGRTGHPDRS